MPDCKRMLSMLMAGVLFSSAAVTMSGCSNKKSGSKNPVASDVSKEVKANDKDVTTWKEHTKARAAIEAEDFAAAKKLAEERIKKEPKDAEAHYLLGKAQAGGGDILNASRSFEMASELKPENETYKTAYFKSIEDMAESAIKLGVPAEAAQFYEVLLKEGYDNEKTLAKLGDAYMQSFDKIAMTGKTAEAESMIKKAISKYPESTVMKIGYAEYLMSNDRLMESERILKALNNSHPNSASAVAAYGRLIFRMGDTEKAKQMLDKAMKLNSNDSRVLALKNAIVSAEPKNDASSAPEANMSLEQIKKNIQFYANSGRLAEQRRALTIVTDRFPNEDWALYDLSLVCEKLGDIDSALESAEAYLATESDSQKGLLQYACCLYQKGKLQESLEIINQLEATYPDENELMNEKGQVLARMGKFDEARGLWANILNSNPNNVKALFNYGQLEMEMGNHSKAEEFFNKVIKLDAFNNKYKYFAGLNLIQSGRTEEAHQLWRNSVASLNNDDPYAVKIMKALGDSQLVAKSVVEESVSADVAVPMNEINESPVDVETEYNTALGLARAGRFNEAIQGFREVLSHSPDNFNAMMNLGKVYTATNRQDIATAIYLKALKLNPKNIYALNSLANSYADVGMHSFAYQITEQAKQTYPDKMDGFPQYNVAVHKNDPRSIEPVTNAFLAEGLNQEAAAIVQDAINTQPDNNSLILLMGDVMVKTGKFDKAAEAYRTALDKEPQSPLPYIKMGDLYSQTGDKKSAAAEYEKALTSNFIDADKLFEVADRFEAIGNKQRAVSVWNRLKTMNLTTAQVKKLGNKLGTDFTVKAKN